MRVRASLLVAALAATSIAPLLASAHRADPNGCGGHEILKVTAPDGTVLGYQENRADPEDPSDIDHWHYLEFNDHKGLQTGGSNFLLGENGDGLGFDDPCDTQHNNSGPDLLIL